jgi:aldehyde dehydrogenase (NAD+)
VELPVRGHLNKLGQALGHRQHGGAQAGARHAVERHPLGRLVAEQTDIPAGVVNVVTSSDHLVGEELTLSPKVDMISFTGSTAVGKRIMEKGAATMKRTFLELGGKSATIVLEDADFARSVPMMGIGGVLPRRPGLRHSDPHAAAPLALRRGRRDAEGPWGPVPYGDPQRPDVIMGPLISAKQRDRVLGYIEKGVGRARRWPSAVAGRPTSSRRAGTSSRRCSPTSTTP